VFFGLVLVGGGAKRKGKKKVSFFPLLSNAGARRQPRASSPLSPSPPLSNSSLTCTIPITGLFACGDTMFLGTAMIAIASALASSVCGTCMFISSPSKSAL
jgi:hypothetical protein